MNVIHQLEHITIPSEVENITDIYLCENEDDERDFSRSLIYPGTSVPCPNL